MRCTSAKRRLSQVQAARRYDLLHTVAKRLGWQVVTNDQDTSWDVFWTDLSVSVDRVNKLRRHHHINHFPGMLDVVRKGALAKTLHSYAQRWRVAYAFVPPSLCLPEQLSELYAALQRNVDSARAAATVCRTLPQNRSSDSCIVPLPPHPQRTGTQPL